MIKYWSINFVAISGGLLAISLLYMAGFFTAEVYQHDQPKAYVDGATAPAIADWEMY